MFMFVCLREREREGGGGRERGGRRGDQRREVLPFGCIGHHSRHTLALSCYFQMQDN